MDKNYQGNMKQTSNRFPLCVLPLNTPRPSKLGGSQPGTVVPLRRHLAMSGDIFNVMTRGKGDVPGVQWTETRGEATAHPTIQGTDSYNEELSSPICQYGNLPFTLYCFLELLHSFSSSLTLLHTHAQLLEKVSKLKTDISKSIEAQFCHLFTGG